MMSYFNLLVTLSLFTLNTCNPINGDAGTPSLKAHQELKCSPGSSDNCGSHNDKFEPKSSAQSEALRHLNMAMENFMKTLTSSDYQIKTNKIPMNCADIMNQGGIESGIYTIYPYVQFPHYPVNVLCDQKTDSGGWTTIQARMDSAEREKFDRPWTDYLLGFGKITEEHWIGLKNIYALTNNVLMELRVDIEYLNGDTSYAKYNSFRVYDESKKFQLKLGAYEGTAGDSLSKYKDQSFTTFDEHIYEHCSAKGGFWYFSTKCYPTHPNGFPEGGYWEHSKDEKNPIRTLKMMIKPVFNA